MGSAPRAGITYTVGEQGLSHPDARPGRAHEAAVLRQGCRSRLQSFFYEYTVKDQVCKRLEKT